MFTRRSHLAMIGGASALCAMPALATAADARPLRRIAADKGILFGSALGIGRGTAERGQFDDAGNLAIIARECAVIVPENEMKVYVVGDDPAAPRFGPGDRVAAFARDNRLKLRGHTLLWNSEKYVPGRFRSGDAAVASPAAVARWLRDYVGGVCRHWGAQVYSWDVVNETIDPATGALRDTAFTRALGFDALRIAFELAREASPHAQLVYNDYMLWGASNAKHRDGVLRLLERFRAENVPVDALGIQSHIGGEVKRDPAAWRIFLDRVTAMGYQLLVTEFDVSDKALPADIAVRDAGVAAVARDYLDLMLSYPQLRQFLCWGMVDSYSWLNAHQPRADGRPQRPLPYGEDHRPKPLRAALAAALAAAPKR